jgi:hypothetical protein
LEGPLGFRELLASGAVSVVLGVVSRFATPLWVPYFIFLLIAQAILPDGTDKYVNINMAHEMWKDVPAACPHYFDNSHPAIYLAYALVILNFGNFLCYQVWRVVYYIFFWSAEVHGDKKTKKN